MARLQASGVKSTGVHVLTLSAPPLIVWLTLHCTPTKQAKWRALLRACRQSSSYAAIYNLSKNCYHCSVNTSAHWIDVPLMASAATARAAALREALAFSEGLAREADVVLQAYTSRLSGLAQTVGPVASKTQVFT